MRGRWARAVALSMLAATLCVLPTMTGTAHATGPSLPPVPPQLAGLGAVTTPVCGDTEGDALFAATLAAEAGVPVPNAVVSTAVRPVGLSCAEVPAPSGVVRCSLTAPVTNELVKVPGDFDVPAWLAEAISLSETGFGLPPRASSVVDATLGCHSVAAASAPVLSHVVVPLPGPVPLPTPVSVSRTVRHLVPPGIDRHRTVLTMSGGVAVRGVTQPPATATPQRATVARPTLSADTRRALGALRRGLGWVLAGLAVVLLLTRRWRPRVAIS